MYNIKLTQGRHEWRKQNLVTITKGRKHFDILKCKNCGITGETTSLSTIALKGSYSELTVFYCNVPDNKNASKRIKITRCYAIGDRFENLTPDSEHDVIEAPEGEHNKGGVWVAGTTEPVKVLNDEFNYID